LSEELKKFHFDHITLVTGTPLQNKIEDLWTLLNFLDSQKFPVLSEFIKDFGDLKTPEQVTKFHALLRSYVLRRLKSDAHDQPIVPNEEIIEVELTATQTKYYRAILERNIEHLTPNQPKNIPNHLNIVMELRKCCNHPYLITGVEETVVQGIKSVDEISKQLIEQSGKLVLIDKFLPKLFSEGQKVIICSQMVRMLDILEDYLNFRGYKFERIDGSMRITDRQRAIESFQTGADCNVFYFEHACWWPWHKLVSSRYCNNI